MQVTFEIPDSLAEHFTASGKDPARAALEALAVDGYRTGQLFENDLREMLGYDVPMQVHDLLKEHDVFLNFTADDLEQDTKTLCNLHERNVEPALAR